MAAAYRSYRKASGSLCDCRNLHPMDATMCTMSFPDYMTDLGAVISPIAITASATPSANPSTESLGMWGDPNDTADRQAYADAQRSRNSERPPHY